jgi:hypothetical protein
MAYGTIKADTLIYDDSGSDATLDLSALAAKAPAASPTFTGTVTIPTPSAGDNSTKAASTAFVVASFAVKTNPTFTGDVTINQGGVAQGDLRFSDNDNSHYVGFQAPATVTTNHIWTLPATDGSSGHFLKTDGSGTLSFSAVDLSAYAPLASPGFSGTITGANLTLSGDLTVNGTTTTIDTTNLDVEDKNITIGKVSSPSDSTADGGGLTLKGATDKTWNWVNSTDAWTSSENIATAASKTISDGLGNVREIPQTSKSSAHTIVAADAGKHIYISSGGVTFASGICSAGEAITIVNNSGSDQTITCSAVTMYLAGTATAKTSLTLKGRGMATFLCTASNVYYGSGGGLE